MLYGGTKKTEQSVPLIRYFKENFKITAVMRDDLADEQAQEFAKRLKSLSSVRTADYVSKEEGTEQMKELLQKELPARTEAMEGYITVSGDSHISDKIRHMLETALYRVYVSGESRVIEPYRELLEIRALRGLKVVVITEPPFDLAAGKVYHAQRKPGQIGIIVDSSTVLTGDVGKGDQSTCLYSGKKNLVDLFKESLSNEIKIIELTGKD